MRRAVAALAVAAVSWVCVPSAAAAVQLVPYGTFTSPIFVTAPPGDTSRVFVVERAGRIQLVTGGQKKLFLDISSTIDQTGERGLLSMAFAPDYATSGLFYVFDVNKTTGDVRIDEFQRSASDPDQADATTRRVVMDEPHSATNHNGGQLQFGPDGYLYATVGDNATSSNAQSLSNIYGKILRIDPRLGHSLIPADNPFAGTPGARGEIWALGLRNPWRFSFDRATGDLIIADVGNATTEEIDFLPKASGGGKGLNFGWPTCEGPCTSPHPEFTDPVFTYDHSGGNCAITGGYLSRADDLPSLAGRYLYGDYCVSTIHSIALAPGSSSGDRSESLSTGTNSLVSFGDDACAHLYAVASTGLVSRISETNPAPPCTTAFTAPTPPTPEPTPTPTPQPQPGPEPQPGTSPDIRAPLFTVGIRKRQRVLRSRTITLSVLCNEPCSLIASAHVSGPRGFHRPKARVRVPAISGARRTVRLVFTPAGVARIRRALKDHRRVIATVQVAGADAAKNYGNATAVTVRITG